MSEKKIAVILTDDQWNYMMDLMKKTLDALAEDAPDEYWGDKQALRECIDAMLDKIETPDD